MSFEEWFNEQEGTGLRSERAWDDTCSAQLAMFHIMRNWMQAAYEAGQKDREWVGLTDADIDDIKQNSPVYVSAKAVNAIVPMVEAKLKKKNTLN